MNQRLLGVYLFHVQTRGKQLSNLFLRISVMEKKKRVCNLKVDNPLGYILIWLSKIFGMISASPALVF
ncbi:hypothetical protein D3C71_1098360 [compost metagenome]